MSIHPTSIVAKSAHIPASCTIGPFCTVGPNVILGEDCELVSHVVLDGHLTLGRVKGRLGPQARAQLQGIPFDATFAVAAVDLVASEPSPRGHRYTTLVRAPLGTG